MGEGVCFPFIIHQAPPSTICYLYLPLLHLTISPDFTGMVLYCLCGTQGDH